MFRNLKMIYWELKRKDNRFLYLHFFLCNFPGQIGERLRAYFVPRYFKECGDDILIHDNIRYRGIHNLTVGNNVELGYDVFIQSLAGISIGNNSIIGPGSKLWSVNLNFKDADQPIFEQGYDLLPVTIDDDVWIGANSIILPGVHLPKGCVVSAGSVVNRKNYKPYSILAGNPCRMIGSRISSQEIEGV